ncbi:MAG: carboxypeptidase-like regulatory domain-containing protein, partial [Candidatus Thorarchaeota archaeon]
MGRSAHVTSDNTFNRIPVMSDVDESTPWWNTSYHYRQYINLTDTSSTPRVNAPTHISFSFENNSCFANSLRVVDENGLEVPSQPYDFTYWEESIFVKEVSVFWYANISADSTATYWLYFSEDASIETTNYDSVVSFARTSGVLSGKFNVNYWSFMGDWYNVTSQSAAGGKLFNGAHLMDDGTWNWNWGTYAGGMHWNPDGLGGQGTSNTAPIASTTFVNQDGPLFVNYTTQLPFGSGAKLNVTYTFYKWGWVTRVYIEYSAVRSGSGRTDEWVFYPYITTKGIEVAEDLTQTPYSNWVPSSNKGKPAGFGWWNDNGMSHGTVRISHDSWNTNPSYTNNYENYYYRWYDSGSYEFWDTIVPTIYAQAGTVLEETCAFAVWNGAEGQDGYMRVFNATSQYLPIQQELGNVSSYSFKINVHDLGGTNIEGANVTLLNPSTGEILYKASGEPYTSLTDSDGNVTFIGLLNQSYRVDAWIDSQTWLSTEGGSTGMNVTWSENRVANGPFTSISITLELASIDIHLEDLMGADMASVGSETIRVRVYNASDPVRLNWKYLDYQYTDSSGDVTFNRLPKCTWMFNFSYSDTDTGHIFQEADIGLYTSYIISSTDIVGNLSRPNWQLPLVTLEFNVKAYDGGNVENAFVRITKRSTDNPIAQGVTDHYNITHYTDSSGDVTFYRVLNGSWNIYLYRTDDYGQTAYNDSVSLDDIQGYHQTDMAIPLTWLRILVEDGNSNRVTGAQIDVKVNGDLLVTAYTDTSGWYNYTWIKANDTSVPWAYTITVTKAGQSNSMTVYASFNHLYYNKIDLLSLAYNSMYTELNCTATTLSWSYGDNQTFIVGWYNRTGTNDDYIDTTLSDYNAGWLNFTIWHQGQLIDVGWWNSSSNFYISHGASDGIHFIINIDTLYFKLNASVFPYLIEIRAEAPGYLVTDIYTVTLVVTAAPTIMNGITSDSPYWSDGIITTYSLTTSPDGRPAFNLTDMDFVNYTIYNSLDQIISTGSLSHLGSGIYQFSDGTLDASDIGVYEIIIWLKMENYVNHTVLFSVTILPIPTVLTWAAQPGDYIWGIGSQGTTLFIWDSIHSTPVATADTITFCWINQETGETILIDSSSSLSYTYNENIVWNGTWRIHAYYSKNNYVGDNELSDLFTVYPASTEITLTSSDTANVEWGSEFATFDFDFDHQAPSTPIIGADLYDISWTGEFEFIDNGDGSYRLRLLAVQEAANYTVSFSIWIENRTMDSSIVTVNVLIPLQITAEAGQSEQNPIQQFWTRDFNLILVAGDLSNQSEYVSEVTVTYSFAAGGIQGSLAENITGEFYYLVFPASNTPGPGIYEIILEAFRAGCSSTTSSIYIEILPTPTQANAETQILTVYYADSFNLNFTWLTTIDGNDGVTNPDSVIIQLWKGVDQVNDSIGGVIGYGTGDYAFLMDTVMLQMSADMAIAPTAYYFVITLYKLGYESPFAITMIVLVLQTPSEMTAEPVESVLWSEELTLIVNLYDIVHSEAIWTDAIVTFTYGDYMDVFQSLNNGTFILTFNSMDAFYSSTTAYVAEVSYALPNYLDGAIDVSLVVNPVPASIVLDDLLSEYDWNSTFPIAIAVKLDSNELVRVNVSSAYYYWTGYEFVNGTLLYNEEWSEYRGTVDIGQIPAGVRTLNIVALRTNYSISIVSVVLIVAEMESTLSSDTDGTISAIYGVDESVEIRIYYTITSSSLPLEGAEVSFIWDGLERTGSWNSEGYYVFQFNPTVEGSLTIPDIYHLTFTATLTNFTTQTEVITLNLAAETRIVGGPYRVEEGHSLTLIFAYWDVYNNRAIGTSSDTLVQYQIGSSDPITPSQQEFNGTHYVIQLSTSDIGEISLDPYMIRIYASSPGYQNWTAETDEPYNAYVTIYIDNPTVDILGFRIQSNMLFLTLGLTIMFVFAGSLVVGIQRYRIPYPIKQINKALKKMQDNRKVSVAQLKSMGAIISELLAPGLAELDLDLPPIHAPPESDFITSLGDETEGLLDELDALDEIGT